MSRPQAFKFGDIAHIGEPEKKFNDFQKNSEICWKVLRLEWLQGKSSALFEHPHPYAMNG
jgi:hypothetical protein